MSPSSIEVRKGLWSSANLAEYALLSTLSAFGVDGLRQSQVSRKRLSRWFDSVLAVADEAEAKALTPINDA